MAAAFANDSAPLNTSGLVPLDKRVIVKKDPPDEKKGSLIIPESVRQKEKFAMTKATVVAVGTHAWGEAGYDAQRFGLEFDAPAPGDRVKIGRYAGDNFDGDDGQEYTILNDEDVLGFLGEQA